MQSKARTVDQYIQELPEERRAAVKKLRAVIKKNLPKGFKEQMGYGMIGYVVPKTLYPDGYHCDPKLPLPFMNVASQANSINLYHMGIYGDKGLHEWFVGEYAKLNIGKLDMGKSCIRFKKIDKIPFDLIGELVSKITPKEWIAYYEQAIKNR